MRLLQKKDFEISRDGISSLETHTIGGIKQSILIQAEHLDKPVLLFIHGGPSMPLPGVSCRGRDFIVATATKELVKHFILVFWDQRGTGKSYHSDIPRESINLNQYISDAEELVSLLRNRFNQQKIVVAAHSWGSVIGLSLASRIPEQLHAYFGLSQIINWPENDRLCREWALNEAKKRNNKRAIRELTLLGEPPYVESFQQWAKLRNWQMKFKSMIYTDATIKHPGLMSAINIMLRSPDYSLKDIYNSFYKGFLFSYTQQMIEDFATIDFLRSAPKLDVPVVFIHGSKDVHVSGSLLQQYVDKLDDPKGKHLLWVDKSSHFFHPDDARQIETMIIENVDRITK